MGPLRLAPASPTARRLLVPFESNPMPAPDIRVGTSVANCPGMPRAPRVDFPGAFHHVCAGGIEKRDIVKDDRDRKTEPYVHEKS